MKGFLNLLKPTGMTSFEVVSRVRRSLGIKRVGHAGTLDPMAAGVLPVAVGAYTRLIHYLDYDKCYLAVIAFGRSTSTGDAAGKTLEQADAGAIDQSTIASVLPSFTGRLLQKPPAYSAIRVDGKRAHELARAGVEVQLSSRQVEISCLELLGFDAQRKQALLRVECSSGTYVRSLACDLGLVVGCPAHLAFLLRTKVGAFNLADASLLDHLGTLAPAWLSPDVALNTLVRHEVGPREVQDLRQGRAISAPVLTTGASIAPALVRCMLGSEVIAICERRDAVLQPKVVP